MELLCIPFLHFPTCINYFYAMIALEKKYQDKLASIIDQIQQSELLSNYLEEEDEELYNAMKDHFEPMLNELHEEVAENDPLQLVSLEEHMLDDALEGLYLPRVLGYSVLRGAINDDYKYIRPQEHFKKVLLAIANSSNFDLLKQRIGQTVEVGFALSSDIWITNLIAEISNKQVKNYLASHKDSKYRDIRSRHTSYLRYKKQFAKFNFLTANKPVSAADLKIEYRAIKNFLNYRASKGSDSGKSLYEFIAGLLGDATLGNSAEHLEIVQLIAAHFDLQDKEKKEVVERLNAYDLKDEEAVLFESLRTLQFSDLGLGDDAYARLFGVVAQTKSVEYKKLLEVINDVNDIGYINPDAIEAVRAYYNGNAGLSVQNDCMRNMISGKFTAFMSLLSPRDFHDYFELNKTFVTYMNIFSNEKFNQHVKTISLKYVKQLIRTFTEKRSKDYQDIKKFVIATFSDLGFLTDKELKDLFKTKRKKPAATS